MVRTQIYLTAEEQSRLRSLARRVGRKQSELIRDAIDEFLRRRSDAPRRNLIQNCRGMWKGREDAELRSIRQEVEERIAS